MGLTNGYAGEGSKTSWKFALLGGILRPEVNMAVLVEGISVIVRRDAIERKIAGGWETFSKTVPNRTLCADEEIARVGFMNPYDTQMYIKTLEKLGLRFLENGEAVDIAVVDQLGGPTVKCRWLEFGRLPYGGEGRTIAACWLVEGPRTGSKTDGRPKSMNVEVPEGWDGLGKRRTVRI